MEQHFFIAIFLHLYNAVFLPSIFYLAAYLYGEKKKQIIGELIIVF